MLRKILFGLSLLVVILVVVIIIQPSQFRVARSVTVNAPAAEIFAQIDDLRRWEAWSPWAKLDPAAKVSFAGPAAGKGATFKWAGNSKVGEGTMTVVESRPGDFVRTRTDFTKPFVGSSFAEFTFAPEGSGTKITWVTFGENDFIGKAMCLVISMDKMLGGQMDQGLMNIKSLAETKTPARN